MTSKNSVVVLARRDVNEAMRVAAGLTIFGNDVEIIVLDRPLSFEETNIESAELLELAQIPLRTAVPGRDGNISLAAANELANIIGEANMVISL